MQRVGASLLRKTASLTPGQNPDSGVSYSDCTSLVKRELEIIAIW